MPGAKAELFRRLHLEPAILVLPNAWDVASAKKLAEVRGCRALATSSGAVARSLGFEDGEKAPAAVMVGDAGRIAQRRPPGQATSRRVTATRWNRGGGVGGGLVGINFEDSPGDVLKAVDEQAAHIRQCERVPNLVINARVDLHQRCGKVEEAVERGNAYLAAGADCVYPIFCPTPAIAELAQRIDGPINVLAEGDVPEPADLQALGVARMTWGGGLARRRVRRSGARRRGRAQRWMIRAPRPRVR